MQRAHILRSSKLEGVSSGERCHRGHQGCLPDWERRRGETLGIKYQYLSKAKNFQNGGQVKLSLCPFVLNRAVRWGRGCCLIRAEGGQNPAAAAATTPTPGPAWRAM